MSVIPYRSFADELKQAHAMLGKFVPTMYYISGLCLIIIATKDTSYTAVWISESLEVHTDNYGDGGVVGLAINRSLPHGIKVPLSEHYEHAWGKFYPLYRFWHNKIRRRIPARKIMEMLSINVPRDGWGTYRSQALDLLETPVHVRLL